MYSLISKYITHKKKVSEFDLALSVASASLLCSFGVQAQMLKNVNVLVPRPDCLPVGPYKPRQGCSYKIFAGGGGVPAHWAFFCVSGIYARAQNENEQLLFSSKKTLSVFSTLAHYILKNFSCYINPDAQFCCPAQNTTNSNKRASYNTKLVTNKQTSTRLASNRCSAPHQCWSPYCRVSGRKGVGGGLT